MVDKKTDNPNQDVLSYEVLLKAVEYHRVISKVQKRMYQLLLRGELDRGICTAVFLVADAFEMALMCAQKEVEINAQSRNKPT
jgi:hypothetical protein